MKNSIKRVQSESSFSALSSVRILREAKKIFQYILMAVAVVATASCSNELDEALQPAHNSTLQFVVSDFPAFGEDPETRASQNGIPDEGKTAWEEGDELLVSITFDSGKKEAITLEYKESVWTPNGKLVARSTITEAIAVYAPDCEIDQDGSIGLKEGKRYGLEEYIPAKATLEGNTLTVTFYNVNRTYSRLRIVGLANQTLTVTTTGFTPAAATSEATEAYTLTADDKGNAYLYGTFAEGATVTVKQGDVILVSYPFTAETEQGKSYALEARPVVDGASTEIDVMVHTIKSYLEKGITTIVVTGSEPAIIDMESYTITAIGEAIYRLSQDASYYGKIDLIIPNVTKIIDEEFAYAYALNSITLPKVTTVGERAFYDCLYLEELMFGSVVTSIKESLKVVFHRVGEKVDGGLCNLVLNSEQVNAEADYQPNIETNTWWDTEWKSITLK